MLRRSLVDISPRSAASRCAPFATAAVVHPRRRKDAHDLRSEPSRPRLRANAPRGARGARRASASSTNSHRVVVRQLRLIQGRHHRRLPGSAAGSARRTAPSPPVGADQVQLKDGERRRVVLRDVRCAGGSPTLVLKPTAKGCFPATGQEDDHGTEKVSPRLVFHVDGRTIPAPAGICASRGARTRPSNRTRRRALEPAAVMRRSRRRRSPPPPSGCGSGGARLRHSGPLPADARRGGAGHAPCARCRRADGVMQAPDRSLKIATRYGEGASSSP